MTAVLAFLLAEWRWFAGAALLIAAAGWGAYAMHRHDKAAYTTLESEFTTFKATVAAKGEQARQQAVLQQKQDKKRKDDADKRYAQTVAALDANIRGLRAAADSRSYSLPAAPATSSRPDLACFDREQYQREMGILDARLLQGSRNLADEGTTATVGLDTGKTWAQSRTE